MPGTRFHSRIIQWSSRPVNSDGEEKRASLGICGGLSIPEAKHHPDFNLFCVQLERIRFLLARLSRVITSIMKRCSFTNIVYPLSFQSNYGRTICGVICGFRGLQFAIRFGDFLTRWKCYRLVAQLINRLIAYAKPFTRMSHQIL